jgi:thiol:disulfide interchange protein
MAARLVRLAVIPLLAFGAGCASVPGVDRYDPSRDAQADVAAALAAAPRLDRQVLVIVGGDWCRDCRELDALLAADRSLAALRDARYVPVKVYVGSDNRNDAALARFPKLAWVPTLYVLDARGAVVRHAPSTAFHAGTALDADRVRAFLATDERTGEMPWK